MDDPAISERQASAIEQAETWGAHNYHPLEVVVAEGDGAWLTDIDGNRYLDFLSAYSAVNFGHRHPDLTRVAIEQLNRITITSRAVYSAAYGPFVESLARLCGKQMALPMNTGVEAVETALKVARKWGYEAKGVAEGRATIIVMAGNFHGRTTTVISFSNDPTARAGYGPFTPGFVTVPFGDLDAVAAAIDDTTVAVLVEPIQGEAGVVVPPAGFLPGLRALCTARNVLMVADEIQSGLGRTGTTFACEHDGVVPDIYVLGKALGGGIVPVSAVVADADVLGLIRPGQHGSTFGGNPLSATVGREAVRLMATGALQKRSADLGAHLHERLQGLVGRGVTQARGMGLWAGVDIDPDYGTARSVAHRLLRRGVIAKDTQQRTLRLAPPLVIERDDLDRALDALTDALDEARTDRA